jgi:hypothetical protein
MEHPSSFCNVNKDSRETNRECEKSIVWRWSRMGAKLGSVADPGLGLLSIWVPFFCLTTFQKCFVVSFLFEALISPPWIVYNSQFSPALKGKGPWGLNFTNLPCLVRGRKLLRAWTYFFYLMFSTHYHWPDFFLAHSWCNWKMNVKMTRMSIWRNLKGKCFHSSLVTD